MEKKAKRVLFIFVLFLLIGCNKEQVEEKVFSLDADVETQVKKLSYAGTVTTFESEKLQDGLTYYQISLKNKTEQPLSFYLIQMDRSKKNLQLKTISLSKDSLDYELGKVKDQALASPLKNKILFASNGDFFAWQGNPWGPFIRNKQIVHDRFFDKWHSFLGIKEDGELLIGSTLNYKDMKAEFVEAIGGVEKLLSNFAMVSHANSERHPRTAIGFNKDKFYLLVVDGRKADHSIGMTFREMSELFFSLKVQDALNLDGGGSTTLIRKDGTGFKEVNQYSDAEPRAVANGLAIVDVSLN